MKQQAYHALLDLVCGVIQDLNRWFFRDILNTYVTTYCETEIPVNTTETIMLNARKISTAQIKYFTFFTSPLSTRYQEIKYIKRKIKL